MAIRTDVTDEEIEDNKQTWKDYGIPNLALIAATKGMGPEIRGNVPQPRRD